MELIARTCWIFDLDGTLTVPIHDFDAIRRDLGLPPGMPVLEALQAQPAERRPDLERQLARIELDLARRSQPQPGATELLEALAARDARLGVLTRNLRSCAIETLRICRLEGFFADRDILARGDAEPKPSPAGIQALLTRWGARAAEAVMVGDFRLDIEAGRSAGVATIYVDFRERFEWDALADLRVRDLQALAHLLTRA